MHRFFSPYLYAASGGMLASLALNVPALWIGAYGVSFLFFIALLREPLSRREAGIAGALFGFVYALGAIFPIWYTLPLTWLGISGLFGIAMIAIVWLSVSLISALPWALYALFARELSRLGTSPVLLILSLATLWPLVEMGHLFAQSAFLAGDSFRYFDTAGHMLGYALGHGPSFFIAPAALVGILGLSALVVLPGIALSVYLASRTRSALYTALAGIVFVLLVSLASVNIADSKRGTNASPPTRVALVSTEIPSALRTTPEITEMRRSAVANALETVRNSGVHVDALIFPEWTRVLEDYPDFTAEAREVLGREALIIDSSTDGGDILRPRLIGRILDLETGEIHETEKRLLFPFGEYLPTVFKIAGYFAAPEVVPDLLRYRAYARGNRVEVAGAGKARFGMAMCSEVFSSARYAGLAESGAEILVNISSLAPVAGDTTLDKRMRSAARIRAVENGLPIVRTVSFGEAVAYDCRGRAIEPSRTEGQVKFFEISASHSCRR